MRAVPWPVHCLWQHKKYMRPIREVPRAVPRGVCFVTTKKQSQLGANRGVPVLVQTPGPKIQPLLQLGQSLGVLTCTQGRAIMNTGEKTFEYIFSTFGVQLGAVPGPVLSKRPKPTWTRVNLGSPWGWTLASKPTNITGRGAIRVVPGPLQSEGRETKWPRCNMGSPWGSKFGPKVGPLCNLAEKRKNQKVQSSEKTNLGQNWKIFAPHLDLNLHFWKFSP